MLELLHELSAQLNNRVCAPIRRQDRGAVRALERVVCVLAGRLGKEPVEVKVSQNPGPKCLV